MTLQAAQHMVAYHHYWDAIITRQCDDRVIANRVKTRDEIANYHTQRNIAYDHYNAAHKYALQTRYRYL